MKMKKNQPSQVNNADDVQESGKVGKNGAGITSDKQECSQSYCLYYPFEVNSPCRYCHEMLGTTAAKIELHLKSHGVERYEYECGACRKGWPSWRSVMTHYSKSSCRHTAVSTVVNLDTKTLANEDSRNHPQSSLSSTVVATADIDNREPVPNETTVEEENKLYYCNLCVSGGWSKPASLSQHMRRMHASEYNATIEVPMIKRRWTKDETMVLAELEASMSSSDSVFVNQELAKKFPSRTFEAIKSQRKRQEYRALVEQIRLRDANNMNHEKSTCTNNSSISSVQTDIVVKDNNINNCFRDENSDITSSDSTIATQDVPNSMRTTTDVRNCPDIRQYLRQNAIDGKVQLCNTMNRVLMNYVDKIKNTDCVNESLHGIHEALAQIQPRRNDQDGQPQIRNKRKSQKSKRKAQQFAHYQRLFKSDKSKLASEIFDQVDTSAAKPPLVDAQEHFRRIWEANATDTDSVEQSQTIGTDILLAPITREDIALAISQTHSDTAVGPDRVSLEQVRSISRRELWCAFNIWLGTRTIPDELRINRTALLPKGNEGLENIKNWRPITIASLLVRLYNKILARRMQLVFKINQKQVGFKPINGVGQNTSLLHNLLRHARTNKNNLFVCLLDVSKAFDSVPHDSIKRALKKNGCPCEFIDLIDDQYTNITTRISYGKENSKEIHLKRGVKQGDPMSSILFNLVIDELFEILGDRFGYEIEGVGNVNSRAFADDIALFSGTEIGMKELLRLTEEFLIARGLEINAKKCIAICLRKAGKVKKSQIADSTVKNPPVFTVNHEPIRLLGVNDQCKYLGIQYTPLGAVDSRVPVSKLKSALASLSKAPLKPQQKVLMLRSYLIPRFIHTFTYTECYPKLMGQQDRLIRRWLKQTLRLPSSTTNEFFYIAIKEGGLGIPKLFDIIGIAKIRLNGTLLNAGDPCLRYLVETQGSSMYTRWCQALKLNYRPSTNEINTRKNLVLDESRERFAQTVHGGGSDVFRNSPITNQWLAGQTRILRGNTFIRCIQMRTNTIPTRVTTTRGQNTDKKCRRCGLADETLIHILQTCPITQGMRCHRHNNVCRKVTDKLKSKGYQVFVEKSIPSPGLQTNISRPDIIATRGEEALVLDITCVYESTKYSLHDAYRRKVDRYENLCDKIKEMFNVQTVVFHGLCIGSRGSYDTKHLSTWHSIGFSGNDLMFLAIGVMEDSLRVISFFNNANSLKI